MVDLFIIHVHLIHWGLFLWRLDFLSRGQPDGLRAWIWLSLWPWDSQSLQHWSTAHTTCRFRRLIVHSLQDNPDSGFFRGSSIAYFHVSGFTLYVITIARSSGKVCTVIKPWNQYSCCIEVSLMSVGSGIIIDALLGLLLLSNLLVK